MRVARMGSKGQVLVLVALMMAVLVAVAAFALDVGLAYGIRAKLNAAVDAAAIAALRERMSTAGTQTSAETVAANYLAANFPNDSFGIPKPTVTIRVSNQGGAFIANVEATAVVPTYFAKIMGLKGLTVTASSEATRSGIDVALVLDTTGSLAAGNAFQSVQEHSKAFLDKFSEMNDRVALVPFATGVSVADSKGELVLTDGIEISKSSRGFNKGDVRTAISGLAPSGYTASEFGMRMGVYQLAKVANPSPNRAIVFFSDGAPNTFSGNFPIDDHGGTQAGNLFSGTTSPGPPRLLYRSNLRQEAVPQTITLYKTPEKGGGNSIGTVTLPEFPVTSAQRAIGFYDNTAPQELKCDVNKAARNLLENVANDARSRGITVHALGYGDKLDEPDISSDCSTFSELGSTIMKRVANTTDSDTYNPAQPSGIFCRALNDHQLGQCFDAIGNALLRLTK